MDFSSLVPAPVLAQALVTAAPEAGKHWLVASVAFAQSFASYFASSKFAWGWGRAWASAGRLHPTLRLTSLPLHLYASWSNRARAAANHAFAPFPFLWSIVKGQTG